MFKIKSAIVGVFARLGYTLQRTEAHNQYVYETQDAMSNGFKRMKALGISPLTIIDIGAAQGTWTEKALAYWPAANYELVEPLEEQKNILEQFKIRHPKVNYHLAVAGETAGETFLNISPDLDGSGVYGGSTGHTRKVPVITIDEIVAAGSGDIMIKLDTHGYEIPILKGAAEALKRTSLLVIEVYGFYISPTCLIFHELSAYLDEQGFRLIDMVDIMRRPGDGAFWQADAFYIRKDNTVFENNLYAPPVS